MNEIANTIAYKRLRAPRADGEALYDPPLADEAGFLQQNLALRRQADCDLQGYRLSDLRREARSSLLECARRYTSAYRDVPEAILGHDAPLILVGHQPELVHPGVWFKNFVLSELAQRTSAHAVNLLIDNDAVHTAAVRVPGGSSEDPSLTSVPMDRVADEMPYEERRVLDLEQFSSFGGRVADVVRSLVREPLIKELWPLAVRAAKRHGNLGRALAEARHLLEAQWGLSTLELPLSAVCDEWPFRWFAAQLLVDSERLRDIHNGSLAEYRLVNKVRSHTHPVPDLARRGSLVEVPFWLWTVDRPERHPAYVERDGSTVVLTDGQSVRIPLSPHRDDDAGRCVDRLREAHAAGVRLRPRALITTMFARLVLSDVFIHGIGGAKYDQLTDAIVRRFFGVEPPEYLVATATFKLPVPRRSVEAADVTRVDHLLRELKYHPEVYVEPTPETLPIMTEKRRWLQTEPPVGHRLLRHQNIERANRALRSFLAERREQLKQERHELRAYCESR